MEGDPVQAIFEFLRHLDRAYDLSVIYIVLSVAAAMAAVWTAQCLTSRAGFASMPAAGVLVIRVILYGLALVWFTSAGMALYPDMKPWTIDVIDRAMCLILTIAAPRIVGGRIGADHLLHLAERRARS